MKLRVHCLLPLSVSLVWLSASAAAAQVSETKIENAISRDAGAPGDNYELYAKKLATTLKGFSPGQLTGILKEVPLSAVMGQDSPPTAPGTAPPTSPEMASYLDAQQTLDVAQKAHTSALEAYQAAVSDKSKQRDGVSGNYTKAVNQAAAVLSQAKSDLQAAQKTLAGALDSLKATGLQPQAP